MKKTKAGKVMAVILKVLLGVFVLIPVVVVIVTGAYLPKHYKDAFNEGYYQEFDDVREQVVAFGVLAPSSHNVQPWRIVLNETNALQMDLYLSEDRTIPYVDSNYEQLVFSCGTLISYMESGAQKIGYHLELDLFPNGELVNNPTTEDIHSTIIARIILVESSTQNGYDTMAGSTKRLPYKDQEISEDVMANIFENNTDIELNIISQEAELNTLKDILIRGVKVESTNQKAMLETRDYFRYTTYQKNKSPYGLSLHSDNPSVVKRTLLEFLASTLGQSWEQDGEFWYQRDSKNIEQTNYFGMIITDANSRTDQLESGILFGEIYLKALNNNISIQPSVQVIQVYEEMTTLNTEINNNFAQNGQHIQIIFRIGETDVDIPVGFRMSVNDIVE